MELITYVLIVLMSCSIGFSCWKNEWFPSLWWHFWKTYQDHAHQS